jgi:hypothetical protein
MQARRGTGRADARRGAGQGARWRRQGARAKGREGQARGPGRPVSQGREGSTSNRARPARMRRRRQSRPRARRNLCPPSHGAHKQAAVVRAGWRVRCKLAHPATIQQEIKALMRGRHARWRAPPRREVLRSEQKTTRGAPAARIRPLLKGRNRTTLKPYDLVMKEEIIASHWQAVAPPHPRRCRLRHAVLALAGGSSGVLQPL